MKLSDDQLFCILGLVVCSAGLAASLMCLRMNYRPDTCFLFSILFSLVLPFLAFCLGASSKD